MPLLHHFFCIFLLGLLACSAPVVSAADTTLTTTPEATTPTSTTGSMLTDVALGHRRDDHADHPLARLDGDAR